MERMLICGGGQTGCSYSLLHGIGLCGESVCNGVILMRFLPTSGCVQDPISLTSQWITAATAGFTSSHTEREGKAALGLAIQ